MSGIDTADEAGGESIFSSDGLPPLTMRAPKITSIVNKGGLDLLDSNNLVDPAAAISIYTNKPQETPQQKLARLQKEVAELEKELKDDNVSKLASELSSRLETGVDARDNLMHLLDEHVKNQSSKTAEEGSGLVYELYGGVAASSSSIEQRLLKLEQVIGGSNTAGAPLLPRLQALENKMKRVDEKALDDASTKAKVIRSDLEAAAKARSKLASSSSSGDNKTISELHSQLIQLEGISEHLPALTHRLQQLAHLHVASSNFASRLTQSEESIGIIQGSLGNLEASLSKVEQGMIENIKMMDSNLKKLEEKLG